MIGVVGVAGMAGVGEKGVPRFGTTMMGLGEMGKLVGEKGLFCGETGTLSGLGVTREAKSLGERMSVP